jgi:hypothetical protein
MKRCATLCTVGLFAFLLSAQDSPRGEGHGGFEPRLGMMSMGPGSRTPVTGAPYSATQMTETQQALGDGNQIARQEQSKVFRDSQGRVRMEHTAKGAQAYAVIAIFDPVAGFTHVLHPSTMTAVKTPVHVHTEVQNGRAVHPKRNTSDVQTEDLGTQMVNGLAATGTRTTRTIPAGAIGNQQAIQIVREAWVSVELKVPVMIKSSDPRFGSTVMQLTNITRAEPDAALFQVPANYTISAGPSRTNRPSPRQ